MKCIVINATVIMRVILGQKHGTSITNYKILSTIQKIIYIKNQYIQRYKIIFSIVGGLLLGLKLIGNVPDAEELKNELVDGADMVLGTIILIS